MTDLCVCSILFCAFIRPGHCVFACLCVSVQLRVCSYVRLRCGSVCFHICLDMIYYRVRMNGDFLDFLVLLMEPFSGCCISIHPQLQCSNGNGPYGCPDNRLAVPSPDIKALYKSTSLSICPMKMINFLQIPDCFSILSIGDASD